MANVTRTGLSPSPARLPRRVPLRSLRPSRRPYNPGRASTPPVWAGPLSLAATRGVTVVFLSSGYLDVSVRRVRLRPKADAVPPHGGFPHSGIRGSMAARASPRHFAACRALPRPWEPRASPVRPYSLARRRASPPAALCAYSFSFPLFPSSGPLLAARALVSRTRLLSARLVSRFLAFFFSPILSMNRPRLHGRAEWRMWGSNPRPPACKAGALAS